MESETLVSVVMSVYNGERFLRASLDSVLSQEGLNLELVVVDDGSTDGSSEILEEAARGDKRVRVLRQPNAGLTRSLSRACAESRGRYIARQDADDVSFQGRLRKLAAVLDANAAAAVASSWVELLGPLDERLLRICFPTGLEAGTREVLEENRNPVHGSVMFRRSDFDAVGGYRSEFYFAQDADLWLRLADRGGVMFLPEILYGFRAVPGSITSRNRAAQTALFELAKECRRARIEGRSESSLLAAAADIRPGRGGLRERSRSESTSYFIGCLLLKRRNPNALGYLWRYAKAQPIDPKGWVRLLQAAGLAVLRSWGAIENGSE